MKVLYYLNHTRDRELCFANSAGTQLQIHCDAAWLCHEDMKGHTGVSCSFGITTTGSGSGSFASISKKQKLTSTSSFESELIALNDALNLAIYLRGLLSELGVPQGTTMVYEDNEGVIKFSKTGKFTTKSRHIALRGYRVAEMVAAGEVSITYLDSSLMTADILTKTASPPTMETLSGQLLGEKQQKQHGFLLDDGEGHQSGVGHTPDHLAPSRMISDGVVDCGVVILTRTPPAPVSIPKPSEDVPAASPELSLGTVHVPEHIPVRGGRKGALESRVIADPRGVSSLTQKAVISRHQ